MQEILHCRQSAISSPWDGLSWCCLARLQSFVTAHLPDRVVGQHFFHGLSPFPPTFHYLHGLSFGMYLLCFAFLHISWGLCLPPGCLFYPYPRFASLYQHSQLQSSHYHALLSSLLAHVFWQNFWLHHLWVIYPETQLPAFLNPFHTWKMNGQKIVAGIRDRFKSCMRIQRNH